MYHDWLHCSVRRAKAQRARGKVTRPEDTASVLGVSQTVEAIPEIIGAASDKTSQESALLALPVAVEESSNEEEADISVDQGTSHDTSPEGGPDEEEADISVDQGTSHDTSPEGGPASDPCTERDEKTVEASAHDSTVGDDLASDKPRVSHCAHSFGKSTQDLISSVGARVHVFGWDDAPVVGYCGAVQKADPDGAVLMYYDDGHRQWHDPNYVSRFQFILQEPAGKDIYQLRRRTRTTHISPRAMTKGLCYQAKALDNRVY